MRYFFLFCLTLIFTSPMQAVARQGQVALLYDGPGICEGCADDAAIMLHAAGLTTERIYARDLTPARLTGADLVVIPGGTTNVEMRAGVTEAQMQAIRDYVFSGGRYFGICLGAYFAGATLDDAGTVPGLALFAGDAYPYSPIPERVRPVIWNGRTVHIYQQEAPSFWLYDGFNGEVIATYPDGEPAAFIAPAGRGHIGLIGPHPEALLTWMPEVMTDAIQRRAFKHGVEMVVDLMSR